MKRYKLIYVLAAAVLGVGPAVYAQAPAAPPTTGPTNEILESAAPAQRARPTYTFTPGVTIPEGPVKLDWESVHANYKAPTWMTEGKFGIFIHWGPYAVAAHHNEWYPRHMYSNGGIINWHKENFGPQDKFGYKDFIPLFTAEKFDPDQWAKLFKDAGARWVIPTAEHHDRFAMWDSKLTRWDAKDMGPKRDLIGDLGKSVRANGIKYGVSNHRLFGYDFLDPAANLKHDQDDPANADFYHPRGPKGTLANQEFCNDWLARNIELIEQYQPDFMWFDWDGTGARNPVKLQFAAYYMNRAKQWGKEVAFSQKGDTFPSGTGVPSHEKGGRAPKEILSHFFLVDDVISDRSWGYTKAMKYRTATSIVHQLADHTAKGGALMLNISPRGDGSIPDEQQAILRSIGKWLETNGEAIYSTRPWKQFDDGNAVRYTTKGDTLYAILTRWPEDGELKLSALTPSAGEVRSVTMLGSPTSIHFTQTPAGLTAKLPTERPGEHAYVLKIEGLKLSARAAE